MLNEFVYCPRLFFYEWVDGLFRESADTLEGSAQHKRVDARPSELPAAGEAEEKIHARSVTLSRSSRNPGYETATLSQPEIAVSP